MLRADPESYGGRLPMHRGERQSCSVLGSATKKRAPLAKAERTTCRDCGGLLTAMMSVENTVYWAHKAGDCDPWSEPEGRGTSAGRTPLYVVPRN